MSTTTPNINLVKPSGTENYSLIVWNANSDIIDAQITDAKAGSAVRIFKCKNDVTSADNALSVGAGDGRFAKLAGLITQVFSVAPATADGHAVSRIFGDGRFAKLAGLSSQVFSMATPTLGEHGANKTYVDGQAVPVGTVIDFAGDVAPDGYLPCNGGVVSTTTYANLYAVLGVLWANTAGASTPAVGEFRLPPQKQNGLGLYARGVGNLVGVGVYQEDTFKAHTHNADHAHTGSTASDGNHNHKTGIRAYNAAYVDKYGTYSDTSGTDRITGDSVNPIYGGYTQTTGAHTHAVTVDSATLVTDSTGDATETRPRSITMLKCIKY